MTTRLIPTTVEGLRAELEFQRKVTLENAKIKDREIAGLVRRIRKLEAELKEQKRCSVFGGQ